MKVMKVGGAKDGRNELWPRKVGRRMVGRGGDAAGQEGKSSPARYTLRCLASNGNGGNSGRLRERHDRRRMRRMPGNARLCM